MKKVFALIVCLLAFGNTYSQSFQKGGNYITVGYGLDPWGYQSYNNGWGNHRKSTVGPFVLAYERGITDVLGIGRIGVGGGLMHTIYNQKWDAGNYEYKSVRSRFTVMAKAAYHFEFNVEKLDVYAGIGGGVHFFTDTESTDNPGDVNYASKRSHVGGGHYVFAGVRYYFTKNFGVYVEGGHGLNAINGGVAFAF